MPSKRYDKRFSIIDGGWGVQMGPDLMFQQLEEGYDEGPDNIALICTHQSWGYLRKIVGEEPVADCLTWTYRQLMRAARDLAIWFEGKGVKRGDTLITFLPSCAEWALCFWIAAVLDLTFVPLDHTSLDTNSSTEHDYPLHLLKPSAVLVFDSGHANNFDELYSGDAESINLKIVCDKQADFLPRDWIHFEPPGLLHAITPGDRPRRPDLGDHRVSENRVAAVLFTKESPREPFRGCALTVKNVRTALVNQYINPGKRYLVTCAPSSSATLEAVMIAWKRGAAVVFPGALFSARTTLAAVNLYSCERLICTSPQLKRLVRHPSLSQTDLGSLESLSVHGEVIDIQLLQQAKEVLKPQWVTSSLTMAEGFGALGWGGVFPADRTLDSVGTVQNGALVKICGVDNKDHRVLRRGEEGVLHLGGDTMIQGYLGEALSARFYHDLAGTWFVTNFLATMDDNGLIRPTRNLKPERKPVSPSLWIADAHDYCGPTVPPGQITAHDK
ncbi:acetyl-CoA synthetase-like protein [Aureobasidium subglaciale]|nr:acetyl-CoA synthetase-like protein [Aureobasidium subglaciale]